MVPDDTMTMVDIVRGTLDGRWIMELFDYRFELTFTEVPNKMTINITANNYKSAFLGLLYEMYLLEDEPIKIEYINVK